MDKEQNKISLAEKELSVYEQGILDEKTKFKGLDKMDQCQYIHETFCMFDFLQDAVESLYVEDQGVIPNDNQLFGMNLIFNYVGKRIKASEAAVE